MPDNHADVPVTDPDNDPNEDTYGKVGFEAYAAAKKGLTYDDKPIPAWKDVGGAVRAAWNAAALAVIDAYDKDMNAIDDMSDADDNDSDDIEPDTFNAAIALSEGLTEIIDADTDDGEMGDGTDGDQAFTWKSS